MTIDEEYGPMGIDTDRLRILDALNTATTLEAVAEIQATCPHVIFDYDRRIGKYVCHLCGHQITETEYFEIDDIPF